MNILVMIDAEGLGGIFMNEQVDSSHPLWRMQTLYDAPAQ